MSTLMKYHTISANPNYYWENSTVAQKLRANELKTYEQYKMACKEAGCICYSEVCYNSHMQQ